MFVKAEKIKMQSFYKSGLKTENAGCRVQSRSTGMKFCVPLHCRARANKLLVIPKKIC
jgi:hypothetical protein